MAQFVKAWKDRGSIMDLLVLKASEADQASAREYAAAVRIQSWFRGYRVRGYYAHIRDKAILIQRHFRGHLGREEYRRRLQKSLDDMRFGYYQDMATRIQKNWRGFFVRKYIHNYRAYKEYLKGVMLINEIVRARTKKEKARVEKERQAREEQLHDLQEQDQARRHHYLLSTFTKGGIFKQDSRRPSHPFENRMRAIQFATPTGSRRSSAARPHAGTKSAPQTMPANRRLLSTEQGGSDGEHLPPLVRLQGPFKPPEAVRRLKSKPPKNTLRMATVYDCEQLRRVELRDEEWRNRIVDEEFLPFSYRKHSYYPLIHTTSPYRGHIALISSPVRPARPDKDIASKPFQTIIKPVTTFDELNSTY